MGRGGRVIVWDRKPASRGAATRPGSHKALGPRRCDMISPKVSEGSAFVVDRISKFPPDHMWQTSRAVLPHVVKKLWWWRGYN